MELKVIVSIPAALIAQFVPAADWAFIDTMAWRNVQVLALPSSPEVVTLIRLPAIPASGVKPSARAAASGRCVTGARERLQAVWKVRMSWPLE